MCNVIARENAGNLTSDKWALSEVRPKGRGLPLEPRRFARQRYSEPTSKAPERDGYTQRCTVFLRLQPPVNGPQWRPNAATRPERAGPGEFAAESPQPAPAGGRTEKIGAALGHQHPGGGRIARAQNTEIDHAARKAPPSVRTLAGCRSLWSHKGGPSQIGAATASCQFARTAPGSGLNPRSRAGTNSSVNCSVLWVKGLPRSHRRVPR